MHLYQPVRIFRETGYSLVEFMVAITISLIIMLAVAIAWQSGFKTQQSQTDVSRLNETIRFSIDLLSREIKQAGLINTATTMLNEVNFCSASAIGSSIVGVNDPATINPAGAPTAGHLPAGTTAVLNKSDAIRVRYYGEDPNAGTTGASTNLSHDCLGTPITAGALVEDTMFVAADPNNNNEPALWCHTSNVNAGANSTLPMVAGVESLQILYGEDISSPLDGIIDRYVPWQLVQNADNILSVKVSVVARSPNPVSLDTVAKTFYHFGGATAGVAGSVGSILPYTDPTGSNSGTTFIPPANTNEKMRLRLPPMSTEIAVRNFDFCQ
jgi:type IV pilus assembly protein PilW